MDRSMRNRLFAQFRCIEFNRAASALFGVRRGHICFAYKPSASIAQVINYQGDIGVLGADVAALRTTRSRTGRETNLSMR